MIESRARLNWEKTRVHFVDRTILVLWDLIFQYWSCAYYLLSGKGGPREITNCLIKIEWKYINNILRNDWLVWLVQRVLKNAVIRVYSFRIKVTQICSIPRIYSKNCFKPPFAMYISCIVTSMVIFVRSKPFNQFFFALFVLVLFIFNYRLTTTKKWPFALRTPCLISVTVWTTSFSAFWPQSTSLKRWDVAVVLYWTLK